MNFPDLNRPKVSPSQGGFSMIEVLVTMLIVSLALLGTAGLQAYSMRLNQGGQFRTQAVFLVSDLAERIEANKAGAVAPGAPGPYDMSWDFAGSGAYDITAAVAKDCRTSACNTVELATYDLWQWQRAVGDPTVLPQSSWSVVYTPTGPTAGTYAIRVSWVDRLSDGSSAAHDSGSQTGINAAGTGERFFYTATRTVSN